MRCCGELILVQRDGRFKQASCGCVRQRRQPTYSIRGESRWVRIIVTVGFSMFDGFDGFDGGLKGGGLVGYRLQIQRGMMDGSKIYFSHRFVPLWDLARPLVRMHSPVYSAYYHRIRLDCGMVRYLFRSCRVTEHWTGSLGDWDYCCWKQALFEEYAFFFPSFFFFFPFFNFSKVIDMTVPFVGHSWTCTVWREEWNTRVDRAGFTH